MQLISIAGMLVLLLCAWLMSYHRRRVNLKTVFWGMGMQLLFAIIILRSDYVSYIGMGILALMIILFMFRERKLFGLENPWLRGAAITVLSALLATGIYWISTHMGGSTLGWFLVLLLCFQIINARFKLIPAIQPFTASLLLIALVDFLVLGDLYGQRLFKMFSEKVAYFLSMSDYGAQFLFGNLAVNKYFFPEGEPRWPGFGFQFAFKVLPTIIFFGGFMSILYYLGIMQKVIEAMSRFMRWTMGTSGAETMSCTANIFVGQTEAPLLIKPFLEHMTKSELLTIMVGGFATIAGGVLAGYIAMGVPAGHLIAASVMSAPAALVIGKIIYPELEHSETAGDVELPRIKVGDNVIEAASNGIIDGLKLAVNVGAMLIGFIALIAVIDLILNALDSWIDGNIFKGAYYAYTSAGLSPAKGEYAGYFPGSLQTLFGTLLRPLAFMMGVPWKDAAMVGNLLGIKLSLNEFVAFGQLGLNIHEGLMSERSIVISTYALCGFANFSSIGIQIGGISAIAPSRKTDLARLGLKAMLGGALASWTTATIAGMLI